MRCRGSNACSASPTSIGFRLCGRTQQRRHLLQPAGRLRPWHRVAVQGGPDVRTARRDRSVRAGARANSGGHCCSARDPAQALPYLRRALDAAPIAPAWPPTPRSSQATSAWSYAHLQRWDEAERFNAEGIKLKEQLGTGRLVYNSMNSARIAEGRGDWMQARTLYEGVIKSSPEPGIEWDANAGLARVAIAGGQKRQATDHYERALQIIERTRSDLLKTDYKLSYLSSLIQFYREYVDALIDQGMIERALEVADSSRGRVLAERQRAPSPTRVTLGRVSIRRPPVGTGSPLLLAAAPMRPGCGWSRRSRFAW